MNLRWRMLLLAAGLSVLGVMQTSSLLLNLRLHSDFPWWSLISGALIWGVVIGIVLRALWPVQGRGPVPDWRATLLLPTLALLLVGGLLIDRWQAQHSEKLSIRAFTDAVTSTSSVGWRGHGNQFEADVDGLLLADLLRNMVIHAGGHVDSASLPLTRQGDRVQGETRITLRAGLRQVPFTLRYEGAVVVNRTSPLPAGRLPPARATLERLHD